MIILLFVIALTLFLFSSFTVSYRLQTINRAIIYTPIEIFELSAPIIDLDEGENPRFDKVELRNRLKNYYDNKLKDVFPNYEMTLYFYNVYDGSICTYEYCSGVEVTISGRYMFTFNYSRSVSYEIHKGGSYGK